MDLCADHQKVAGNLESITCAVKRLEANQQKTAEIQIEMSESLAVMAKTLSKIEDTNVVLERVVGRIDNLFVLLSKNEKEHDEMFSRLRDLEDISANPRLKALEAHVGGCPAVKEVKAQQNRLLWGGLISISLALIATVTRVVWK